MPMTEWTTYQVVCDHDYCREESSEASGEGLAKSYAIGEGFVTDGKRWFCGKHAEDLES